MALATYQPISSLDVGYKTGDLSVYPDAIDNWTTLYQTTNNATSTLRQSLAYNGKQIILNDGSNFPAQGIVRVGPQEGKPGKVMVPDGGPLVVGTNVVSAGNAELIVYTQKNGNVLSGLYRGFAGSAQGQWLAGMYVTGAVMAEHHNVLKDAIINIETNLGTNTIPAVASLNAILQGLESRFLAPKPIFRAFPLSGAPPLRVRFQNFSGGDPLRYLWSFGDGTTSTDESPTHTFNSEGIYTVQLNVITSLGAQGISTKSNYITVNADDGVAFFYVEELNGVSVQTASLPPTRNANLATVFTFVDQSEGNIVERIWSFNDGNQLTVNDPDVHIATHVYSSPGTYSPTLLVVFDTQQFKRVSLYDNIIVS